MSIDVEYAIKQDIRNNPVVREIDLEQKREFQRLLGLAALIVGMLLFAASQQFKMVANGINVERLRQELAAEQTLNRQLQLQLDTELRPQRLEQRAREMGLVYPAPDQVRVIERIRSAVPPRAVVADAR